MNDKKQSIGCEVCECMFNSNGKNCTLTHIKVGNSCGGDDATCTCCENFQKK